MIKKKEQKTILLNMFVKQTVKIVINKKKRYFGRKLSTKNKAYEISSPHDIAEYC